MLFEKEGGVRGYNGGSELVQSTLYAFVKFSQCNSFVLLMIKLKNKIIMMIIVKKKSSFLSRTIY
jgi:hypothetical protein